MTRIETVVYLLSRTLKGHDVGKLQYFQML